MLLGFTVIYDCMPLTFTFRVMYYASNIILERLLNLERIKKSFDWMNKQSIITLSIQA